MISLPEILKSKGYFTLQAGKFHMGDYARRGFDQVHEDRKINGLGVRAIGIRQWIIFPMINLFLCGWRP